MKELYAHSPNDKGQWHRLEEHLRETAKLAERFAAEFGCGEWGRLAGLWQDELLIIKEVYSHENL